MNALREIIDVQNNQVVINLPPTFQQRKVEVIILLDSDEDKIAQEPGQTRPKVDYGQYFGVTNIGQETIDKQLKSIREK